MKQIAFLLLPEFPLYALTPAIEALRIANQHQRSRVYEWSLLSVDGAPVTAGNGMTFDVHAGLAQTKHSPFVFVLGGNHPRSHVSRPLLNWLRRQDRAGASLGAIDTGAFVLAKAGVLGGVPVALHWEAADMFRAEYPGVEVVDQLFHRQGRRWFCAGGHAVLDMMATIIAEDCGAATAQLVADAFLHSRIRPAEERQRAGQSLIGAETRRFAEVVGVMEAHIADPLDASELRRATGLTRRALHRVVMEASGSAPMRYYLKLRLQAARNAIFYSDQAIADVAYEHGFASPEVFSRSFKAQFGLSPREFRASVSREELQRFLPELSRDLPVRLGDALPSPEIADAPTDVSVN